MNTAAGSTPVSDGNSLFVYFGSHLASLDLEGSMVWVKEIDPAYLEESVYAAGSSLVLSGDFVIVLRDRESADEQLTGWLAAFDKATGERVWKKEWKDTCCSYVTPLTIDREGKEELFVLLAGEAISFDPQTGKRVRRRKHAIRQPVASPVVEDNLICVASGAHHNRQARCWEIVEKDGKTSWKSRWKTERWVPEVSSPILMGGRLYLLTEKGILRSVDAKTGKLLWRVRLETGWYRASLLAGAGKLYALGESGVVSVVSSETGEIIAVNRLPGSNCLASPAVAGNCLLIRSERRLYCVTGTDEPVAEAA